jgi:hypothetical protein
MRLLARQVHCHIHTLDAAKQLYFFHAGTHEQANATDHVYPELGAMQILLAMDRPGWL